MKKILSILLAALMLVAMTSSVFAGGMTVNSNHGVTGAFGVVALRPVETEDDEIQIAFIDEDNHTLTAKDGTVTLEDGEVVVTIKEGELLPASLVPENKGDDAFYQIKGYYIIDENGEKIAIDPTAYVFTEDCTLVYTDVVDTWVPFNDMKQDRSDWYYKYVRDLSIAGVVNGYPDGSFKPQGEVKWGEALKMIILATGYEAQAATGEHWASGYLDFAKANGFVAADAEIDLNAAITRLDYATVAAKALGLKESEIETPFADTEDALVLALYEAGIIEGSIKDGVRSFNPDKNITRAEMSTVIWRINNLGK